MPLHPHAQAGARIAGIRIASSRLPMGRHGAQTDAPFEERPAITRI